MIDRLLAWLELIAAIVLLGLLWPVGLLLALAGDRRFLRALRVLWRLFVPTLATRVRIMGGRHG